MAQDIVNAEMLKGIAYRLLGSASDAEDAVQEGFARLYALPPAQREDIRSPEAWLTTTVSRICLDVLRSARVRREAYVGEWLPEPVAAGWTSQSRTAEMGDPQERVGLDESLSMAFMVICETLTPAERIAFVLHDVFAFRFPEIAPILDRSPQACRQLASSARQRIRNGIPAQASATGTDALVAAFGSAWQSGDLTELLRHLDPEASVITDGGGVVVATLSPVHGSDDVAHALLDVPRRVPNMTIALTIVNGEPGLIARDDTGAVLAVVSLRVTAGRVDTLWVMRNPHKLTTWR
jgi:RNA polymerase sigma-70 factor (ECF subfamily)